MSKFLFLALAVAGLYFLFKGDRKKKEMGNKEQTEKLKATGDLVKDPQCGSYVRKDGDIRVRDGEQVHVFCSYECREKYLRQLGIEPPSKEPEEADEQEKES